MTRETIMQALRNRGYEVTATDAIKNGVTFKGITIGTDSLRPTFYIGEFLECEDDELEDVVDVIVHRYNQNKGIDIDINRLIDWDYVKDNLQLCIQKKGNERLVKQDYLDLELYVRVLVKNENDDSDNASFKVLPEHLPKFGVSEEELFDAAWKCTKPTIVIEDLAQALAEMGMPVPVDESMMILAGNQAKLFGAIAIVDEEKIGEVADRYGKDLAILPSSIHEILLLPIDDDTRLQELNAMVKEINATQVLPEEVLSDHVYKYSRIKKAVIY